VGDGKERDEWRKDRRGTEERGRDGRDRRKVEG